jgi:hypothetical protein
VVAVGEQENGGVVLNGDGDMGDGVIAVIASNDGALTQSATDADSTQVDVMGTARVLRSTGTGVAFQRRELDAGVDINGDGDQAVAAAPRCPPRCGCPDRGTSTVPWSATSRRRSSRSGTPT